MRKDLPGDAALGTASYIFCDLLHELAGHGGVCIATGGRPATFSSFHLQCVGGWQPLISAAGILMNLTAGILLWLVLQRRRQASVQTRFFLWFAMAYNLFTGWGYIVSSSITNSCDWANAFRSILPRTVALGSAISTTFGAWGFLFVPLCLRLRSLPQADLASSPYITRSRAWIFVGAVLAITFVVALGPGVKP